MAFTLDPRLPLPALAHAFQVKRRLHIAGFLAEQSAKAMHDVLLAETPWQVSTNSGDRHIDLGRVQIEAMTPGQIATAAGLVTRGAGAGFQYLFDSFSLTDAADQGKPLSAGLQAVLDFFTGQAFLAFARMVTGDDRIDFADCQATLYRPGHFLTRHDDDVPGKGRLYAYVANLTPAWRADFGGLLAFLGHDGHLDEAFTPAFNALNIFAVPAPHLVSWVAPFAPHGRLSVTGWLRRAH
jgi:SM-20-related protein